MKDGRPVCIILYLFLIVLFLFRYKWKKNKSCGDNEQYYFERCLRHFVKYFSELQKIHRLAFRNVLLVISVSLNCFVYLFKMISTELKYTLSAQVQLFLPFYLNQSV